MPKDFGIHQRRKSSGLVQASNTMRAGPLNVRVTTSSRSEVRCAVVGFFMRGSLGLVAAMGLLLLFQFFDDRVELVEARAPELAVAFDPGGDFFQLPRAELAGAHAADLLGDDEAGLFQDTDVL